MNDDTRINLEIEALNRVIDRKPAGKRANLETYLAYGAEHAAMAKQTPSSKVLGQEIKIRFPGAAKWHSSERTNCGWLSEAVNNPHHEASDILNILGVSTIYDLGYESPTVIRRKYYEALRKRDL